MVKEQTERSFIKGKILDNDNLFIQFKGEHGKHHQTSTSTLIDPILKKFSGREVEIEVLISVKEVE